MPELNERTYRKRFQGYVTAFKLTWQDTDPPERAMWVPFAIFLVLPFAVLSEGYRLAGRLFGGKT